MKISISSLICLIIIFLVLVSESRIKKKKTTTKKTRMEKENIIDSIYEQLEHKGRNYIEESRKYNPLTPVLWSGFTKDYVNNKLKKSESYQK